MNASPARTIIGSAKFTQPSPPTVAVASKANRLPVSGSILKIADLVPGLDAFQVKTRNEPVLGKAEGEMRVLVKRQHLNPFPAQACALPSW